MVWVSRSGRLGHPAIRSSAGVPVRGPLGDAVEDEKRQPRRAAATAGERIRAPGAMRQAGGGRHERRIAACARAWSQPRATLTQS